LNFPSLHFHEGERRNLFLRYVGEVATVVSRINNANRDKLYQQLLAVAKKRTAEADVELDDRGEPIEEGEEDFGGNVIMVGAEENST
jgi:DNA topoisomerase VI subunit B